MSIKIQQINRSNLIFYLRHSLNLPLTPNADICRISRNSLSIIANSKPKTFIITIAKEIKRINASSIQAGQIIQSNNASYPFLNALIRGKTEILKIIERLIDNQSQDVFEILSDVFFFFFNYIYCRNNSIINCLQ